MLWTLGTWMTTSAGRGQQGNEVLQVVGTGGKSEGKGFGAKECGKDDKGGRPVTIVER